MLCGKRGREWWQWTEAVPKGILQSRHHFALLAAAVVADTAQSQPGAGASCVVARLAIAVCNQV
jgi:hypothetical protein